MAVDLLCVHPRATHYSADECEAHSQCDEGRLRLPVSSAHSPINNHSRGQRRIISPSGVAITALMAVAIDVLKEVMIAVIYIEGITSTS